MAIKIEMLRSFCAVAKAGNLSDAADHLGRTQSAVSMTLKQLETHLGSPLFESERKNRLTALGEQVFRLGQIQLKQFDSTVQAIELSASAPQGMLRISAVPSVAALVFPHVVRDISQGYPRLKIELRDADTQQVLDSLVQGWADLGIASSHHVLKGIASSLLFSDHFGLVLSDTHRLADQSQPITIDDVFSVPFLRNALCDQIQTPRFKAHLAEVDVTVHNTQSLLAMLRQDDWVTVLPQSVLGLAPKGLVFRPIRDLPDMRQVYLYRREHPASPDVVSDVHDLIASRQWALPSASASPLTDRDM